MFEQSEMANLPEVVTPKSGFRSCHACFWLFSVCNPMLCTVMWSINALLFIWCLRFLISLCVPEKRKTSTVSSATRSGGRTSQDNGSSETSNLLTPVPFTSFYVENVV